MPSQLSRLLLFDRMWGLPFSTLSLLLTLAQHHAFKQALRRLRFAPLVAACLARMQRAPNCLELELLTTLSQSGQLDPTVLATLLALCAAQDDDVLQLSAASQLCELCLEPANQSVVVRAGCGRSSTVCMPDRAVMRLQCHSGGVSRLVALLQDQTMPKHVVLLLASSVDAVLECSDVQGA